MDHAATAPHDTHAGHGHDDHGHGGHGHEDFDAEIEMVAAQNWPPVSLGKFAMWLFLATEVMFFTGLIGTYFVLRLANEWPDPTLTLNVPLTAFNTFLLIVSSVTMVLALEGANENDPGRMKKFLAATTLIGACFLGVQVFEYFKLAKGEAFPTVTAGAMATKADYPTGLPKDSELRHHVKHVPAELGKPDLDKDSFHHFRPGTNLFGSTFYIMTGCHGAHVAGGVFMLAALTLLAYAGKLTVKHAGTIEVAGLYWHFVDLVWIILFTVVYLF